MMRQVILLALCNKSSGFSHTYGVNPECPSADAEMVCNNDCEMDYVSCVMDCGTDGLCISECNRDSIACTDKCPCHDNCYDGCPCEFDTLYCRPCLEEFIDEYHQCENKFNFEFLDCTELCAGNDPCYIQCHHTWIDNIKDCPCKQNCQNGCPCPNYAC